LKRKEESGIWIASLLEYGTWRIDVLFLVYKRIKRNMDRFAFGIWRKAVGFDCL